MTKRTKKPPAPKGELAKLLDRYLDDAATDSGRARIERFQDWLVWLTNERKGELANQCALLLPELEQHSSELGVANIWWAAAAAMWEQGGSQDAMRAYLRDNLPADPDADAEIVPVSVDNDAKTACLLTATGLAIDAAKEEDWRHAFYASVWRNALFSDDPAKSIEALKRSSDAGKLGGEIRRKEASALRAEVVTAAESLGWPADPDWGIRTILAKKLFRHHEGPLTPQRIGQLLAEELIEREKAKEKNQRQGT